MKIGIFSPAAIIFFMVSWAINTSGAAQPSAGLSKSKKEAEVKGYIFFDNHDELVDRAKKEGRLNIVVSLSKRALEPVNAAFRKKYPFIDTRIHEIRGSEVYLRLLQELKAGLAKDVDVNELVGEHYNDYLPYQKRFDIFGMAQHKVLQIPLQMVDPNNRNVVAVATTTHIVAYNRKLIAPEKVPDSWEDFLKPEFNDRKFMITIRPQNTAALVPAWGLEKTLDFGRKIATQNPVWIRSHSAAIVHMIAGEHALLFGPHLDGVLRAKERDKTGSLGHKVLEPLPVRINEVQGILSTAEHPHAALLWLEFLASPESQKVLDERGPYKASVFASGTVQEQATRGKKLSVLDWNHFSKTPEYQRGIVEAYGFPRAER